MLVGPASDPIHGDALLVVDIDGVLCPAAGENTEWTGWTAVDAFGAHASREMLLRLASLGVPMAWLTRWQREAPAAFAGIAPDDMPVLSRASENSGWWKLDALAAHLDMHPDVSKLVWADDQLSEEDEVLGATWADQAAEMLDRRSIEHLLVSCDPQTGLSRREVKAIEEFLAGAAKDVSSPGTPARRLGRGQRPSARDWGDLLQNDDPFAVTVPGTRRRSRSSAHSPDDPYV